jgi:1,4-dihydroxy-6-naphthoate synthase
MTGRRDLMIAHTPDSDDAFYYWALETGRLRLPGFLPTFHRAHIRKLNEDAQRGRYHVTAVSSVLYPHVADRYAILSVGTSVGRGYGPVLAGRPGCTLANLAGRRVGVPGIPTTGAFLLRLFCPDAVPIEMAFDRIGGAVAAGELDAGVLIHEELLFYPRLGLEHVADLGATWCDTFGLPLPVGLNLIRRDLGLGVMQEVCLGLRRSLRYGLEHGSEAFAWVARFGRGAEGGVQPRFVEMFANDDSLVLAADVLLGLDLLMRQVVECEGGRVPEIDIVEGVPTAPPTPVARGA